MPPLLLTFSHEHRKVSRLVNAKIILFSSFIEPCSSFNQFFLAANPLSTVPLKSLDDVTVSVGRNVIPTQLHVVDPWIRPPRTVETQQAIGTPGDFDLYPRIKVTPHDRIKFAMRPIAREGSNTQRHGVYVITDKQLVRDYLDGKTEHPCSEPAYTEERPCQVVEYQGLNATDCPARETLFPLLEIFGGGGEVHPNPTESRRRREARYSPSIVR